MTDIPARPIPESYWVVSGKLLAGEYPAPSWNDEHARRRLDKFLAAGFDTFIDLTIADELMPYAPILQEQARAYGIAAVHRRFSIGDFGLPTADQMRAILNAFDEALEADRKVYVHCRAGIGRTGTTVGCYLVRHGLTGQQALDQLAAWWRAVPKSAYHPFSPETQEQANFVLHWPPGGL